MKLLLKIKQLFKPRKYTLGPQVFQQRTWLDRQIQDALWNQQKETMCSNPLTK